MGNFHNTVWFEKLSAQSIETTYKRDETFSLQGEPLKMVGFILSGKASAISYSVDGNETWISEYVEGQFIGLMSLLTHDSSKFEIRATSKLTVKVLSHDIMLRLMRENLALTQIITQDLASRLNTSISDLVNVHTLSVKGRVCAELIRLAFPIGISPDRHIIRPSPVIVELARRLNSTRETVSRTISELQRKGILAREPGALIISDPNRLQQAIEYI